MTTEEKAKAYEEALERAREIKDKIMYSHLSTESCKAVSEYIDTIIPELAESEDERIRTELLSSFKGIMADADEDELWYGLPYNDIIAWLEKQKENPKSADSIPSDCVSDVKCEDRSPKHSDSDGIDIRDTPAYWRGWDDAMKQKEQKHPDGCFTCDEYKKGYEEGRRNGFTAGYNKAIKEVEQKEQKPTHFELKAGKWYICHRAFCCRADHLTVKEGERFMCEKDGVVKGFVIKEPEKYFKECSAPAPMEDEQKEQKPTIELVFPKFRVGDIIRSVRDKWNKTTRRISHVGEHGYNFDYRHLGDKVSGGSFGFSFEDDYELVEQKPAKWSEDEERLINTSISFLKDFADTGWENAVECIDWLKSKLNGNTCK